MALKKLIYFSLIFSLFPLMIKANAMTLTIKHNEAVLVLDTPNLSKLPKRFRTSETPVSSNINLQGFRGLHIAASAQFSENALKMVADKLNFRHFTVFDLRQEPHGFVNGDAVSWYAPHNSYNQGKTRKQIEAQQKKLLSQLAKQKQVTVFKIIFKNKSGIIERVQPLQYPIKKIASEAQLCQQQGLTYHHLYVQDYHRPSDMEVRRFVEIVKNIPKDEWVYFHCRAGAGRSSTFMVMFDMMKNAKEVALDDIFARQFAIGGKDLRKLPLANSYKYKFAMERLEFLKNFYTYCKNNKDNFETPWA